MSWERDPGLTLYAPDGVHPSALGASLAALVIHQQLFGEALSGLPSTLHPLTPGLPIFQVPPEAALILQEAAAEANALFGIR